MVICYMLDTIDQEVILGGPLFQTAGLDRF